MSNSGLDMSAGSRISASLVGNQEGSTSSSIITRTATMAKEFDREAQNVTREVDDVMSTTITWTVVSLFIFLNVVVIGFQIYKGRSKSLQIHRK